MSYVKSPVELGLKTDCQGIYIETTMPRIEAMQSTGFLEFGVGDTREDAEHSTIASRMRGHESSKNLGWQHYLLDSIPTPGYRDYSLHKEIRQTFAAQLQDPVTGKRNEVFRVAVEQMLIEQFAKSKDFEPIRVWLNEKIRKCAAKLNPSHEKRAVILRDVQILVIEKVLAALRRNGIVTNFVCELAARIGKTILFLSLAKTMREEFGHESMFIMAYGVGLSVKTSYKDEISKYIDFTGMQFIDAAEVDSEEQYKQALANSKIPVVFISLNPEAEEKYEWINQLAGTHIALLEETDFGTHTDSQVDKVEYILNGKTITRINASGTNIGRLAKAFGKNAIDEIISVPYCMVEQDPSIPNVVVRRFYNMLFNPKMNKLLEDFDKDVLPNINKILEKSRSQEKFIAAVFQDLLGYQPIYGMNLSEAAGEIINHLMLFVNISKKSMEALAKIIEKYCEEHKVLILNGDYTDNKEAEGLTKEELVRLQNDYYPGRDKLLVITNMMGTRSYSIPEIQACLFMQEGGDVYPYMQKYSRCLTPGYSKKFGHIFDFAFDQSKTRNSVMSVAVEAALLIRQKGKTYPDAVREVLNSVNIKDMVSGNWIDANEVIKQFEDNNKLLEIANAHTRITIEDLTSEEIETFGELAKRSSSSKAERSKIDKTIATGKTFDSGKTASGRSKKNPLKVIVEKAIRMINGSATTVLALSNYHGETFLECVDIIDADTELSREFFELYGVYPNTIKRLSDRLEISTLDMIVRMSKYNNKQKHIENNALAILKDDAKLWFEILGNRELKRFIKSKQCQSILVVAGGHGSEIDVLVDMFGIEIVDKIVYNDKYSFLCNQIKRKYPTITVVKGDFTELEFGMKFDVVVGNPPYQEGGRDDQANKLWPQFVKKAYDLVENNGYVAMITPNGWMQPTADIGKGNGKNALSIFNDIFKKNNLILANIDSDSIRESHFKGVGSTFSYYIFQKALYSGSTEFITPDGSVQIDIGKIDSLPKVTSKESLSIVKKMVGAPFVFCDQNHGLNGFEGDTQGTITYIKKTKNGDKNCTHHLTHAIYHTNKNNGTYWFGEALNPHANAPKVIISLSGTYLPVFNNTTGFSNMCLAVICNTDEEAKRAQYILSSKLYKFWVDMQKFSGFNPRKLILTLPQLLLSRDWTDADIYKHFGLTPDEIDYVEANVK
jgi:hypothetical protein